MLIRIALLVKHRLAPTGELAEKGELNRNLEIAESDTAVLQHLLSYMNIQPEDTKISLDHKLNLQRLATRSRMKKLSKSSYLAQS